MKIVASIRPLSILACGLGLLAAACDDAPLQAPVPVAHVSLALRVEPASGWWPDPPYVITATVTNDGDLPIHWYAAGCDPLTQIRGPDDQVVQARPPLACPQSSSLAHLAPGEISRESYPFNGILYDTSAQPVAAPPGTYAVDATFVWFADDQVEWRHETRRQTFDWPVR